MTRKKFFILMGIGGGLLLLMLGYVLLPWYAPRLTVRYSPSCCQVSRVWLQAIEADDQHLAELAHARVLQGCGHRTVDCLLDHLGSWSPEAHARIVDVLGDLPLQPGELDRLVEWIAGISASEELAMVLTTFQDRGDLKERHLQELAAPLTTSTPISRLALARLLITHWRPDQSLAEVARDLLRHEPARPILSLLVKILGRRIETAQAIAPELVRILVDSRNPDGLVQMLDRCQGDGPSLTPILLEAMLGLQIGHDEISAALRILDRNLQANDQINAKATGGALALFNAQQQIALEIIASRAVVGVDRALVQRLTTTADPAIAAAAVAALAAIDVSR